LQHSLYLNYNMTNIMVTSYLHSQILNYIDIDANINIYFDQVECKSKQKHDSIYLMNIPTLLSPKTKGIDK